jgi:hypothetical protein
MKILVGKSSVKVGRKNNFRPTTGNESSDEISNGNWKREVDFSKSKILVVKSTIFPRRNIRKFTWISPDGQTIKMTIFL